MDKIKEIPESTSKNFETLVKAVKNGDVCIMRARLRNSPDKYVTLVCSIQCEDGDEISMIPFAVMTGEDGNPFEQYIPAPDEMFDMATDEIDRIVSEADALESKDDN